ncbi:sensor histidine kinase [Arsenicibacter rosenii]|uniref:Histidine kinase domain-containing protein n=1 Tax=Arsenicibacter rosenii TaxID=1750698 RepID=A0A1S2VDZ3_9BACT|nr:sensor histidine kinase [Arsenicibacter rosenii]OIN56944.1 hypothetical protein BLX24_22535 [Arsenicibacter rosenii]
MKDMRIGLVGVFIGWLLIWPGRLHAQWTDVSFEHYTTDEGLSSNYITALLKDRRGFLWIGTSNGLNRFDGLHFKAYKRTHSYYRKDKDGLLGNYVVNHGLTEAPDGFLWVSTNRGLYRFDPVRERFQVIPMPSLSDQLADNDFVSPLAIDRQGDGWFSTKEQLYRIDLKTLALTAFPVPFVEPNSYADPFFDQSGHFWVQHEGALYRFNPHTRQYTHIIGNDRNHPDQQVWVSTLYQTPQQTLFVLFYNRGPMAYDPVTDRLLPLPGTDAGALSMTADQQPGGEPFFWLGDTRRGLVVYVPSQQKTLPVRSQTQDPMSHNGGVVGCLYRDPKSGIVWIGTNKGLEKVDPFAIKFRRELLRSRTPVNTTGDFIPVVQQDNRQDDRYWLLVREKGLYVWQRGKDEPHLVPFPEEPAERDVRGLTQDHDGNVWIGTNNGVFIYNPSRKSWRSALKGHFIQTLCLDDKGRVWIGAGKGRLFYADPLTDRIEPRALLWPNEEPINFGSMLADRQHRIWIHTFEGLFLFDPDRNMLRKLRLKTARPVIQTSDRLQSSFHVDRQGRIWQSGIGFVVCADSNGHVLSTYLLENGLLADHVFGIQDDNRGHIWMMTDNMLHELDPATGRFRYYDKGNGLIEKAVFMPSAITVNRQGELFFGFQGAFNYVHPDRLRRNSLPPPVVVTGVRVNNQRRIWHPGETLALHPGETTLTVEFAALNFSRAQHNRYTYQLTGFDRKPVDTDNQQATYTNLAPGHYALVIKAANNDGVWNTTGLTIPVEVIPAYYQTWWFTLLIIALLAGAGYLAYRYRSQQKARIEAIRNRIAKDLHDDMGSTLSSIRIFSDVLQLQLTGSAPEAIPVLQRISQSATSLSESMQDIIWTIRTHQDTLDDVVIRMREFGLKMAEARDIAFRMDVMESFQPLKPDMAQRRNLYLIFKESINNAIKYAQCTAINVDLRVIHGQLQLTIQDNGQGFDPATVREGNGLQNLRQRALEINGTLSIESVRGQGTTIRLMAKTG